MDNELSKVTDEVPSEGTVDLSVLEGLDFGPDWGGKSPPKKSSEGSPGAEKSRFAHLASTNLHLHGLAAVFL